MSSQTATLALFATQETTGRPRTWGIGATLGWALLAMAVAVLVRLALVVGLEWWTNGLSDVQFLLRAGDLLPQSLLILDYLVPIAVIAYAARRSGWSVADYLALVRPRGRYVVFGLACAVLPLLFMVANAVQFDVSRIIPSLSRYVNADFTRVHAADGLFLFVVTMAIAGPVMEEIMFRGFLYRGLSESRLGVLPTILLTSIVFALIHVGTHSPARMVETALHGAAWGWLRWYSGSTLVPIACHVAFNSSVLLLLFANLYGWFGISP